MSGCTRPMNIDFDFQRLHVDHRADAGAGETAPRRQRRDDFARLRGLGHHHTRERRAHDGVVDAVVGNVQVVAGDIGIPLRGGDLRTQRVALGDGLVVLRTRDQLLLNEVGQTGRFGLGLMQLRLHAGDLAARGRQLRGGERPRGIRVHRIERGHHLSGLHMLAFLDQHFAYLAGDLGRHRCHAPRDHVAGGIQHGGAAAAAAGADGGGFGGVHGDGASAAEQRPRRQRRDQHDRDHAEHDPQHAPRRVRRRCAAVDAEFLQQVGVVVHRNPFDEAGARRRGRQGAQGSPVACPPSPDGCHVERMTAATAAGGRGCLSSPHPMTGRQ